MKKLFAFVLVITLCLSFFAFAEESSKDEAQIMAEAMADALQAQANGEDTLSARAAYMTRATEIIGLEIDAYGYELDKLPVIVTNKEDYAYDACEAHVAEVRDAVPKRANFGEDIANVLSPYKYFACVAADVSDYSGENDIKITVDSIYAYAIKPEDVAMFVVCIPDGANGYEYVLLQGKGLGENKVECVMSAEIARRMPTDQIVLFDLFAK